jgi:hypothetical protein
MEKVRSDEIRVLVTDAQGNRFHRDWKATADRRDALRWTLESGDLPYYVEVAKIENIRIISGEETE